MTSGPSDKKRADSLSPGERAGVRASAPSIRAASVYGARSSQLPRKLRQSPTDAEAALWRHLRNRQVSNAKFRRQQALGPYVVDFYCHEHRLVIEVDGGHHYEEGQAMEDEARTRWLESAGLRLLRFKNREVLTETTAVLERILFDIEGGKASP